jgi:hypothetical protein
MSKSTQSRSMQNLTRAIAAAFDFDVVTDAPVRRPLAAPEPKEAVPQAAPRGTPSEAAE